MFIRPIVLSMLLASFSSNLFANNTNTGLVTIKKITHWLGAGTIFVETEEDEINASSGCSISGGYVINPAYLEASLSLLLTAQASNKKVELVIGANCYIDRPQIVAISIPS